MSHDLGGKVAFTVTNDMIDKLVESAERRWSCTPPLRSLEDSNATHEKAKARLAELQAWTEKDWWRDYYRACATPSELARLNENNRRLSIDYKAQAKAIAKLLDLHASGSAEYTTLRSLMEWLTAMSKGHERAISLVKAPLTFEVYKQRAIEGAQDRLRSAAEELAQCQRAWAQYEHRVAQLAAIKAMIASHAS